MAKFKVSYLATMAKFKVSYRDTDVSPETIEAHGVGLSGDDYRFTDAKGKLIALIPRSQVRKIQETTD